MRFYVLANVINSMIKRFFILSVIFFLSFSLSEPYECDRKSLALCQSQENNGWSCRLGEDDEYRLFKTQSVVDEADYQKKVAYAKERGLIPNFPSCPLSVGTCATDSVRIYYDENFEIFYSVTTVNYSSNKPVGDPYVRNGSTHLVVNSKVEEVSKPVFCDYYPPNSRPEQKCDYSYCSSTDKSNFNKMSWYDSCSTASSQIINQTTHQYTVRYHCDNPSQSADICYVLYDEPQDCDPDDDKTPEEPEKKPVDPQTPCLGNGCDMGNKPPDTTIPGTNLPCWGANCGQVTPPDYVDPETGKPCWGDKCGTSPPVSGGGTGTGTGGGGTGTGGGGTGTGGGGTGTGTGEGGGTCTGDGCVDFGGITPNLPDVPETFWNPRYKDKTIKDVYNDQIGTKNPYDFNKIHSPISSGTCPSWTFDFIGTVSIPCEYYEYIGAFFKFCATFWAFLIVFRRNH